MDKCKHYCIEQCLCSPLTYSVNPRGNAHDLFMNISGGPGTPLSAKTYGTVKSGRESSYLGAVELPRIVNLAGIQ